MFMMLIILMTFVFYVFMVTILKKGFSWLFKGNIVQVLRKRTWKVTFKTFSFVDLYFIVLRFAFLDNNMVKFSKIIKSCILEHNIFSHFLVNAIFIMEIYLNFKTLVFKEHSVVFFIIFHQYCCLWSLIDHFDLHKFEILPISKQKLFNFWVNYQRYRSSKLVEEQEWLV